MKKIALALVSLLAASIVFAQTDLQVLAVVKLTKNDSITVKLLKNRVESYEKTQNGVKLSLADREKVLEAMIQEKVVLQAATKAGISIPDSTVEQYFMQSISQQVGRQISEAEFEQIVQEQTKMSLDEYMKQMTGMSVSDYKAYLKNQLIVQQYIISQKQNELNSVGPTDEEIRAAYELNKANYVWSDMLKMYLVIVPKATDAEKARIKINDLYKKFKDKKFAAGCSREVIKEGAEKLGWELNDLFEQTILAMRESEDLVNNMPGSEVSDLDHIADLTKHKNAVVVFMGACDITKYEDAYEKLL